MPKPTQSITADSFARTAEVLEAVSKYTPAQVLEVFGLAAHEPDRTRRMAIMSVAALLIQQVQRSAPSVGAAMHPALVALALADRVGTPAAIDNATTLALACVGIQGDQLLEVPGCPIVQWTGRRLVALAEHGPAAMEACGPCPEPSEAERASVEASNRRVRAEASARLDEILDMVDQDGGLLS